MNTEKFRKIYCQSSECETTHPYTKATGCNNQSKRETKNPPESNIKHLRQLLHQQSKKTSLQIRH